MAASARKHGIADADTIHAVTNALRSYDRGGRTLRIGPDRTGPLLEVVTLEDEDGLVAIHSMPLRPKFQDLLR